MVAVMDKETEKDVVSEIWRQAHAREEALRRMEEVRSNDAAIREVLLETSDLPPDEIDRIIREVRAEYESGRGTEAPRSKSGLGRKLLLLAPAVLLFLTGFFAYYMMGPTEKRLEESLEPRPSAEEKPQIPQKPDLNQLNAPPKSTQTPSKDKIVQKPLSDARRIYVSVAENGFFPVHMKLTASRKNDDSELRGRKPDGAANEPTYAGDYQRYGKLNLGAEKRTFHYVFDVVDGPHPLLYFDINADGDLSNDGPPIKNRGTGYFSAALKIPFKYLCPIDFPGAYEIWFFSRSDLWEKGLTQHYSRTQLQGEVDVEGTVHTAYLVDRGVNDADLTNDGIYIDLDHDGEIDRRTEYFPHRSPAVINGVSYIFDVTW